MRGVAKDGRPRNFANVSDVTRKLITVASYLNGLPRFIDHDRKKLGKFIVVDVGFWKEAVSSRVFWK